jgi:hypothetical protein
VDSRHPIFSSASHLPHGRARIRRDRTSSPTLSGPDFEITRVGADGTRTLGTKSYVEWQWTVRPQRGGTLFLQVTLYVRLQDNPDAAATDVRTYSENVSVEVDPMPAVGAWFREYGAATGITVPVIVGGCLVHPDASRTTPQFPRRRRSNAS